MHHLQKPSHGLAMSKSAWLWLARITFGGAFATLMVFEWNRWPNGSAWLGPLGFVWYQFHDAKTLALCAISAAAVLAFFLKPHVITAVVSSFGLLNWLFWGVVAKGIGC